MPSAQKVRWAQLKVGIVGIAALAVLAVLVFLMTGKGDLFASDVLVYSYLGDSAAMAEGSAVRLNGILIGKVKAIELSGESDPSRTVRIVMEIQERYLKQIPVDTLVTLSAENVLGTKFVNLKRGTSRETLKAGGELKARDDKDFLEIVQSAYPLLDTANSILNRIDALVSRIESGQGTIGKFLVDDRLYNKLTSTVEQAEKVTTALAEGKGTLGRLLYDDALYEELRTSMTRLSSVLDEIQKGGGTVGKLINDPKLYNELEQTVAEIHSLVNDLNAGKGTAGKLLKSDELHAKLNQTLGDVNKTLEMVNSGHGTFGQLLVNPSLYENINGLSTEMRTLLKDFRANPKKFLRIKLSLF
jgi:phospholipid/cholesterol/gamma-HCH transport system substrate-binding protein